MSFEEGPNDCNRRQKCNLSIEERCVSPNGSWTKAEMGKKREDTSPEHHRGFTLLLHFIFIFLSIRVQKMVITLV
jgi:hypothetical protein